MGFPQLGNPVTFKIINPVSGSIKWGTTHPNKEEGKVEGYCEHLKERWDVSGPGATVYLTKLVSSD